ncbi:carbohydrate porin [Ruegeria atlantica]|uniref:carbohydrate porin n=1 Tax=Ruegeria atlantica TaxID=81569 RepID=UPI0011AEA710|nr:carbohydrate porin [Ruegeria atlantica]
MSDANGSLTDVEWFPGGTELYKYAEIGWTPEPSKRFLTNFHLGMFHVDERTDAGVPKSWGAMLAGNHTFNNGLMVFGRLGWSDGAAPIARRAVNAGLMWRPGYYDDLLGLGVTVADPSDSKLETQTTIEAFYRADLSDNLALTADVQYLKNPGFNEDNPLVFGLRIRFSM